MTWFKQLLLGVSVCVGLFVYVLVWISASPSAHPDPCSSWWGLFMLHQLCKVCSWTLVMPSGSITTSTHTHTHTYKGRNKLLRTHRQPIYPYTPTYIYQKNRIMTDRRRIECECQRGRQWWIQDLMVLTWRLVVHWDTDTDWLTEDRDNKIIGANEQDEEQRRLGVGAGDRNARRQIHKQRVCIM